MFSIHRFGMVLLSLGSLCAAADSSIWEPGKVVSVEQVSVPAQEPDASCRSVPKGTALPPKCRPENLRATQFWRVVIEVGNKRLVVRPYRSQTMMDALNQAGTLYVDPKLTAASAVEVQLVSSKSIRLRTDGGQGMPAVVDSQVLVAGADVAPKAAVVPAPRASNPAVAPPAEVPPARVPAAPTASTAAASASAASKVVLLENSNFVDLEVQDFKSQEIGDGAVIYSFPGGASPVRVSSNSPVFLVLADGEGAAEGSVELSRLQVAQGARQLAYSVTARHSASAVPIVVTKVSATVRRVSVKEPLPAGEYVVLLEGSQGGFLFEVR